MAGQELPVEQALLQHTCRTDAALPRVAGNPAGLSR